MVFGYVTRYWMKIKIFWACYVVPTGEVTDAAPACFTLNMKAVQS